MPAIKRGERKLQILQVLAQMLEEYYQRRRKADDVQVERGSVFHRDGGSVLLATCERLRKQFAAKQDMFIRQKSALVLRRAGHSPTS